MQKNQNTVESTDIVCYNKEKQAEIQSKVEKNVENVENRNGLFKMWYKAVEKSTFITRKTLISTFWKLKSAKKSGKACGKCGKKLLPNNNNMRKTREKY